MYQASHPDYVELEQILGRAEAAAGAAEVHGLLCGLLCASGRLEEGVWAGQVFTDPESGNVSLQQGRAAVQSLAAWTHEAMNDPVLGMDLLLPRDIQPLFERTAALGEWCQGYLLGLAAGGIHQDTSLPEDVAELVRDITEIARADFEIEIEEADEDDEQAFSEVVEYVRMGVLLINDELQPLKAPPRLQ